MAVSLDDDVPLILTLDEAESAPLPPSNSLGQEQLPSKSKPVGRWAGRPAGGRGDSELVCSESERWWVGFRLHERRTAPVTHLKCDTDLAPSVTDVGV
jgi:hypothetical protein